MPCEPWLGPSPPEGSSRWNTDSLGRQGGFLEASMVLPEFLFSNNQGRDQTGPLLVTLQTAEEKKEEYFIPSFS